MPNSYIIQGTNIVCTNMQVPMPLKIGHTEGARGENGPTIGIVAKKSIYLTEEDRKIDKCFMCKMPAKKWGGFAMLCAGLAIVGCVALVVCTGGAAAPALLALAAVSQVGTALAVGGMVGALAYGAYREAHDCDIIIENKIPWQCVHQTVFFQGQKVLLNSSYMICTQGGTLNLIIDDKAALKAAELFSKNNKKEIAWQLGSKFVMGIVGGLTGGGSVPGVILTIGFDIWFEDSKSNQNSSLGQDVGNSAIETGAGIAEGAIESGAKHGASAAQAWCWKNIMFYRILTDTGDDAVNSAANMYGAALNAPSSIWKDFGKGVLGGIGGAIVNFGIDQFSNSKEEGLEKDTEKQSKEINKEDSNNHIGVYATKN
jgi:hypothetical protein